MSGPPKMDNRVHANSILQEALMSENKYASMWEDNRGSLRHEKLDELTKGGFDSIKPTVAANSASSLGKDFDRSKMTSTDTGNARRLHSSELPPRLTTKFSSTHSQSVRLTDTLLSSLEFQSAVEATVLSASRRDVLHTIPTPGSDSALVTSCSAEVKVSSIFMSVVVARAQKAHEEAMLTGVPPFEVRDGVETVLRAHVESCRRKGKPMESCVGHRFLKSKSKQRKLVEILWRRVTTRPATTSLDPSDAPQLVVDELQSFLKRTENKEAGRPEDYEEPHVPPSSLPPSLPFLPIQDEEEEGDNSLIPSGIELPLESLPKEENKKRRFDLHRKALSSGLLEKEPSQNEDPKLKNVASLDLHPHSDGVSHMSKRKRVPALNVRGSQVQQQSQSRSSAEPSPRDARTAKLAPITGRASNNKLSASNQQQSKQTPSLAPRPTPLKKQPTSSLNLSSASAKAADEASGSEAPQKEEEEEKVFLPYAPSLTNPRSSINSNEFSTRLTPRLGVNSKMRHSMRNILSHDDEGVAAAGTLSEISYGGSTEELFGKVTLKPEFEEIFNAHRKPHEKKRVAKKRSSHNTHSEFIITDSPRERENPENDEEHEEAHEEPDGEGEEHQEWRECRSSSESDGEHWLASPAASSIQDFEHTPTPSEIEAITQEERRVRAALVVQRALHRYPNFNRHLASAAAMNDPLAGPRRPTGELSPLGTLSPSGWASLSREGSVVPEKADTLLVNQQLLYQLQASGTVGTDDRAGNTLVMTVDGPAVVTLNGTVIPPTQQVSALHQEGWQNSACCAFMSCSRAPLTPAISEVATVGPTAIPTIHLPGVSPRGAVSSLSIMGWNDQKSLAASMPPPSVIGAISPRAPGSGPVVVHQWNTGTRIRQIVATPSVNLQNSSQSNQTANRSHFSTSTNNYHTPTLNLNGRPTPINQVHSELEGSAIPTDSLPSSARQVSGVLHESSKGTLAGENPPSAFSSARDGSVSSATKTTRIVRPARIQTVGVEMSNGAVLVRNHELEEMEKDTGK